MGEEATVVQVQRVEEEVIVKKVEPEYWRDPWSRMLGTMFFIFGVMSTILIGQGFNNNIALLALGGLAGLLSVMFLGSFILYNCGCLCKNEKRRFRDEEAAADILESGVPAPLANPAQIV